MSLRCARSPDPPKMTIVEGSGIRESRSPSRSGLSVEVASALVLLHGVTAELIAERGRDLHRVAVFLPGHEPREEGVRDGGHGHAVGHGLEHGPTALARVLDPAPDVLQVAPFLLERALRELEQPRPDDAALEPYGGDLPKVEIEFARVQKLESLAVRLHHSVLDPVVDHLHEMPRAALSEGRPAVRGRERMEHGFRDRDRIGGPAHHQPVAVLESPDPPRHADVEEAKTHCTVFLRAAHRIAEVAVAAIDEHVAGRAEASELVERVVGRLAGGDHRPEDTGRLHLLYHVFDRARRDRAMLRCFLHPLRAAGPPDHAGAAPLGPRGHVSPPAPPAVKTDLP